MGWIPDGTTTEFLDAIRDKIKVIKTPEEMFADTLARVLSGYRWVVVDKTESGQYVMEADIPITTENPWQAYAYLLKEPQNTSEGIKWLPTEIWVPHPLWRKTREILEKERIPRNMVEYIIKSGKTTRQAVTCGSNKTIRMLNIVILDIERVKEILDGDIEDYMVRVEQPCEGDSE
jgi:hypothetical protein